jgi:glycosyltransferase involved in cell wall biosynthesis
MARCSDHGYAGSKMAVPGQRAEVPRGVTAPELSVVVPVYGCGDCVEALHAGLSASLSDLVVDFEIVFIDDRSPDQAWDLLKRLAERDPHVVSLRLSRNFGQHAAITAGLERSRGRWVVVMDCDLQDPPEEIHRLYAKALEGYDIVYAQRRRTGTSLFRRLASRVYFRAMNVFAGASYDYRAGPFSIISRQVVNEFLRLKDRSRQYLLILHWLGFNSTTVEYEQPGRHAGKSSYSLRRLMAQALDGMFFQTTVLLRLVVFVGFILSTLGLGLAVYFVIAKLTGSLLPGFTSLAVFTLTIGGFIIISTGITGLYVGRVFEQVRERPLFVVDMAVETDQNRSIMDLEQPRSPQDP